MESLDISVLLGKLIKEIDVSEDEIIFTISDSEKYKMYHSQDCCESVTIEDICGEIEWLIDSPILRAEERSNSDDPASFTKWPSESYTWTFYEICTLKGSVTIRWYGTSNGYYSENVNFVRMFTKFLN